MLTCLPPKQPNQSDELLHVPLGAEMWVNFPLTLLSVWINNPPLFSSVNEGKASPHVANKQTIFSVSISP